MAKRDQRLSDTPLLEAIIEAVAGSSIPCRLLRTTISYSVKYLAPDSGDTGVRGTVNSASNAGRIAMNEGQPIAGGRFSLWFVMLSPLLGILLGMLALFVFTL